MCRTSMSHGDPSSITKSHSTAAVSGRHGHCTTVSRSGTADIFGNPLPTSLHGEIVISSPPRNDMTRLLTPVPAGASPLCMLATLPRTVPLISGISIWMTRTPCSRSRSPSSLACSERRWRFSSWAISIPSAAGNVGWRHDVAPAGSALRCHLSYVSVVDEHPGGVADPVRVPHREVDHQHDSDAVPDADNEAGQAQRIGQLTDKLEQLNPEVGKETGHEQHDAEDREEQVLDHIELAAPLAPEVGDAGQVDGNVDRQDRTGDDRPEQGERGRRAVLLAQPDGEYQPDSESGEDGYVRRLPAPLSAPEDPWYDPDPAHCPDAARRRA